jgi:hypothetical protein
MVVRRVRRVFTWCLKRTAGRVFLVGALLAVLVPFIAVSNVRADNAPGNTQVFANPPGQVCMTWSAVDGANQYKIYDANGFFIASAAVANTPKCLPNAVGACLMVSASTSNGETARSALTCVNTNPTPAPPTPTPLAIFNPPTPTPLPTPIPDSQPPPAQPVAPYVAPYVAPPADPPPPDPTIIDPER